MRQSKSKQAALCELIDDVTFQDHFFRTAIARLQKEQNTKNHDRVSKLWASSKDALLVFAKSADLKGMKAVVLERQRFIDLVVVGKIKIFKEDCQ